jgi:TRAP-type transport system small permease protein
MQRIMDIFGLVDRVSHRVLKVVSLISFFLLTILITANVFVRFFPIVSLHWFDEIIELLFAYMVFYGAAALLITNKHFSVGNLIERNISNPKLRCLYTMSVECMILVFAIVFFYYSLRLTLLAQDVTNVFAIPKKVLYSCLPISGIIMVIYTIKNIVVQAVRLVTPASGEE